MIENRTFAFVAEGADLGSFYLYFTRERRGQRRGTTALTLSVKSEFDYR